MVYKIKQPDIHQILANHHDILEMKVNHVTVWRKEIVIPITAGYDVNGLGDLRKVIDHYNPHKIPYVKVVVQGTIPSFRTGSLTGLHVTLVINKGAEIQGRSASATGLVLDDNLVLLNNGVIRGAGGNGGAGGKGHLGATGGRGATGANSSKSFPHSKAYYSVSGVKMSYGVVRIGKIVNFLYGGKTVAHGNNSTYTQGKYRGIIGYGGKGYEIIRHWHTTTHYRGGGGGTGGRGGDGGAGGAGGNGQYYGHAAHGRNVGHGGGGGHGGGLSNPHGGNTGHTGGKGYTGGYGGAGGAWGHVGEHGQQGTGGGSGGAGGGAAGKAITGKAHLLTGSNTGTVSGVIG